MSWAAEYFSLLCPPKGIGVAYMDLLHSHGVRPFVWPAGARLQWYRENGEVSWPSGGFSPRADGSVPQ